MKSPKDMRIIQIDITNACIHKCSNCTRFCGHHKKPFFMDFETFKRAVDSLEGYVGTIGIMGGEPTLHPDFERMVEYLASKRKGKLTEGLLRPQKHFMDSIHDLEMEHTFLHPDLQGMRQTVDGPGLWSAISDNYKKYYETIQDNIQYQALNDHKNTMYHQPALVTRKSLGITDEEWIPMRDNCWVQNLWSATITPKGAFFCEIAGALDMLFDGPGGWKIEPGWWKRNPEDFKEQLHWCELCGLACDTFMRDANEEIDDVSPDIYEKLKQIGSGKVKKGQVNVLKIENGVIAEESKASISKRFSDSMPYTESYSARFNEEKSDLAYKKIVGIFVCHSAEDVEVCLKNMKKIEKTHILVPQKIIEIVETKTKNKEDIFVYNQENTILGQVLYKALYGMDHHTYAFVVDGKVDFEHAKECIDKLVLNPGVLLYRDFKSDCTDDFFVASQNSGLVLFSGIAHSVRDAGWDAILKIETLNDLKNIWQPRKIIPFDADMIRTAPTANIVHGKKYVVYGAGATAEWAIHKVRESGAEVVALLDSSENKIGKEYAGFIVQPKEYLMNNRNDFDYALIASTIYYREIKKTLLEHGIKEEEMAWV